jgi:asparagine N-glycosylation enzyme membrane subunit Stt3
MEVIKAVRLRDSTLLGLIVTGASMLVVSQGIPNWHIDNPFVFMHVLSLLGLLAYFILTRMAIPKGWISRRLALSLFLVVVVLLATLPIYGPSLGLMKFSIARKFLILLNAFESPETGMHTTVQEYAKPTAGDWFSNYSFYIFIALAGGIFALRRRRLEDMFVFLWAGSGFYAGLSAIRSSMLLTPALCLLAAVAVTQLLEIISRRRSLDQLLSSKSGRNLQVLKNELRLAKFSPALAAGVLILLMTPSILLGIQLVQGRGTALGQGWYDALKWLGKETPEDSILIAWWDYGHFITAVARKRCVADGATTSFKTIQATALAFMSPEDRAIDIYEDYEVEYIIVPEHDFWLVGAFSQIVGNITDYPEGYLEIDSETSSISWSDLTPKAQNTTVYKLLFAQADSESKNFELIHVSPGSGTGSDTTVRIYRVNYQ